MIKKLVKIQKSEFCDSFFRIKTNYGKAKNKKPQKKSIFVYGFGTKTNGRKGTRIEMVFPFLNYLKIEP